MNNALVYTTKDNIEDIASMLDIEHNSVVKVPDLLFPLGYFQEFPELQAYLDINTFNKLKSGNIKTIQFKAY